MIKVRFLTEARDICSIIEKNVTNGIEIEDWLMGHVDGISFDCMDYPCDMEFCYDCYFQSNEDGLKAREIYSLLNKHFSDTLEVCFSVWITDRFLNDKIRITGI